jgi:NADH:ubiquinone oxidoreductase subunit H
MDAVKLILKEEIVPERAERVLYYLAPFMAFVPAAFAFAVVPIGKPISLSDGSLFPHYYKHAKLGPFVGEPVPGTGTSVWWIKLLPGGRLQYGIP